MKKSGTIAWRFKRLGLALVRLGRTTLRELGLLKRNTRRKPERRRATVSDVLDAVGECKPFANASGIVPVFFSSKATADPQKSLGRKHRVYIKDDRTGKILVTAPSAYTLVDKIKSGWKYDPNKKEGLFR